MILHQLFHKVEFDDVFSDILRNVPEVEDQRAKFMSAFDTLRSITPAKKSDVVIEVFERGYLGDGVHDLRINASAIGSNIGESLLAGRVQWEPMFNRPDAVRNTNDEMIVADLLWQLVAYGFPKETAILSGFILNNRRWPETTQAERIEEICSYIDLHQVSGLTQEDIRKYSEAENIAWITDMTPYSLPHDKAAYDMTCFLDDFMGFNNETKTILIISASEGYENEVFKIVEFANKMLKKPTIAYGKPMLPGIKVMAIFITE